MPNAPKAWKVSLHGGHSSAFCAHAQDPLEALVAGAMRAGCQTYGLTEHAPRVRAEHVFPDETARGWGVAELEANFAAYVVEAKRLAERYAGEITLLCGFEAEIVPRDGYVGLMRGYKERFSLDYMVGSVHFSGDTPLDFDQAHYDEAAEAAGGVEALAVRYYEDVAAMVEALRPEVVGHLDLVRRYAPSDAAVDTPAIRRAAGDALDCIEACGSILDVNTAGYRKGLGRPYPAPWLLEGAAARGIPCCFGDDAHCAADAGAGLAAARDYLLALGITAITVLARDAGDGTLARQRIALE